MIVWLKRLAQVPAPEDEQRSPCDRGLVMGRGGLLPVQGVRTCCPWVKLGLVGALMVGAGVLGALILPALSDRKRKRVPYIVLGLVMATVGLAGLTFADQYGWLLVAAAVMGFFLLAAGPIGFQYGAEVTYPAPEGTTNGLLLMIGQVSGILFILAMDIFKAPVTGSMTSSLLVLIVLMAVGALLSTRLRESSMFSRGNVE